MGGTESSRWQEYLRATVVVDMLGRLIDLTGPEAVESWPFDGEVFALTAWDPAGQVRDRSTNEANNEHLMSELIAAGANVYVSVGLEPCSNTPSAGEVAANNDGSMSSEFIDEGFVVTNLDEAVVVALARRFGQEAIYMIDNLNLTVVSTGLTGGDSSGPLRDIRPRVRT